MTVQLITHRPDNIIGLDIDGWIDAEDIEHITELVESRLKRGERLRIYAEVNNWSGMSLVAFIKDLRFSLKHLQDFDKEAIVSDKPNGILKDTETDRESCAGFAYGFATQVAGSFSSSEQYAVFWYRS